MVELTQQSWALLDVWFDLCHGFTVSLSCSAAWWWEMLCKGLDQLMGWDQRDVIELEG